VKKPEALGTVAAVLVATERGSLVARELPEVRVTFEGFAGDKHAGLTRKSDVRTPWYPRGTPIRNTRQVSLVSEEELAEVAAALGVPHVRAAWLGANLSLRGLPHLTRLPPGARLFFPGGAVLVVDAENEPCRGPGDVLAGHFPDVPRLASRFVKAAWNRRGLVGWVEREGVIRAGDVVSLLLPPAVAWPPAAAAGAGPVEKAG
jgi:hypothetical protein